MKMYCEKCHRVFEGEKCPDCRKKAKREVEPDDVCLLTEKPQIWADMLSAVRGWFCAAVGMSPCIVADCPLVRIVNSDGLPA